MKNQPKLFDNGTKVRTAEVRLSYAHMFELHAAQPDQRPSYNTAFLIPKTDTETLDVIRQAIDNAKTLGKSKKGWKDNVFAAPKFHDPLRDGDVDRPDDEEYAGMMFINAKSYTTAPTVLNAKKERITESTEVYSGCWGHVSVNFYPFEVSGNRGIACGLNGFMKTRDDEPLSGAGNVVNDFESDDEDDFLG